MTLDRYAVFRFQLSLRHPLLTAPGLRLTSREGILIRLETREGSVGWGEASPLPGFSRESLEDVAENVEAALSQIVGAEEDSAGPGSIGHPIPSLDFAIASAVDQASGANHTGSAENACVAVARLIQGTPAEVVRGARVAVDAGFRCIKVKVGRTEIEEELEMVAEVRQVAGSKVAIRLDANRAWSLGDATRFCRSIVDLSVDFIEEPVADPAEIDRLVSETQAPVAIDESVGMANELIEKGCVSAVVLKPTVLGASGTIDLIDRCRASNVRAVLSCAYESAIGTYAIARHALATGASANAVGLGTHAYFADDVIRSRIVFDRPLIDLAALQDAVGDVDVSGLKEIASGRR